MKIVTKEFKEEKIEANKANLYIYEELCKGCGICVHFCPTSVLSLNEDLKIEVSYPEKCTGCRFCELRCPDFAIYVEKISREKNMVKR